jgi:hypothetical protein
MSKGDATDMRLESQQVEGLYPLETVTVPDVTERALECGTRFTPCRTWQGRLPAASTTS